ncbi:hypothetical protein [Sulfurimonas autotrophica]|uniref:hypothetical protein n=1 Tax=Sulfurimonas autotrophica TaxID=202747 RepID=UPI000303A7DA|nr:hypothetical protein [Sulfurimonas autotrophica]
MKSIFFTLLPLLVSAETIYAAKASKQNIEAMHNPKIKCRWVCDKKIYKEQKISEAVSFYKNSKYYKFSKKKF